MWNYWLSMDFKYNITKDAESWVDIAQDKNDFYGTDYKSQVVFIPDDLLRQIQKNKRNKAVKLVNTHLKNHPKRKLRNQLIKQTIVNTNVLWSQIETQFIKRLKHVTQTSKFSEKITCYITTGFMCPYDKDWFMISAWHSLPHSLGTIAHELLHIQFLKYYKDYCLERLTEKQLDILKEAMTFILNIEFNDLLLVDDRGYPEQQKLRVKLQKLWKGNFKEFLDDSIKEILAQDKD